MGGSLLVIMTLGRCERRRLVRCDHALCARHSHGQPVVACQLSRLGVRVFLQRIGDGYVQPGTGGTVSARGERFADERVRKRDRRSRGSDLIDEPL